MRSVGPFTQFRLKLDKETHQPKGFGFCEYKDQDLAASALRNLNKYDLNRRELKVDFASDNKNGVNIRPEDVRNRDNGEVVVSGNDTYGWRSISGNGEYSREEILKFLSPVQESMVLHAIREIYQGLETAGDIKSINALIESLAQDEQMLEKLGKMLEKQVHIARIDSLLKS